MFEASKRGGYLRYPHHQGSRAQSRFPSAMEAQGFVSKKQARGKPDCEMVADGTEN